MNNCIKDNKNHHLLAFFFLLDVEKVFDEAQWGFSIVQHTHNDIDGSFGYLSKKLKEHNNYILANLMQVLMISQDWPFISQLIQETFDFKS